MRQRKAFRTDIFFQFDLDNDFLHMILMYSHFETSAINSDTLKTLL